jgi:hypothetical protein
MLFVACVTHAAAHHPLAATTPHTHPRSVFRFLNESHFPCLTSGITTTPEFVRDHLDSGRFDNTVRNKRKSGQINKHPMALP